MSWSYGVNSKGREIGYSVEAVCDQAGCHKTIDRGLSYSCGGTHGGTEYSCGNYFCSDHLYCTSIEEFCIEEYEPEFFDHLRNYIDWDDVESLQLCRSCIEDLECSILEERRYFYKHHKISDRFLSKFGQVASKLIRIRSRS